MKRFFLAGLLMISIAAAHAGPIWLPRADVPIPNPWPKVIALPFDKIGGACAPDESPFYGPWKGARIEGCTQFFGRRITVIVPDARDPGTLSWYGGRQQINCVIEHEMHHVVSGEFGHPSSNDRECLDRPVRDWSRLIGR